MFFDGSKESCPNYNNNSLRRGYGEFTLQISIDDPSYGSSDFNKTCFNICETNDGSTEKSMYVENGECKECPDENDVTMNNNYTAENPPPIGSVRDLTNKGIYGMCINSPGARDGVGLNGAPSWYSRQQAANISGVSRDRINWEGARHEGLEGTEAYRIQRYWMANERGLTNDEILRLIGNRTVGTLEYTLPKEYMKEQSIGTSGELSVDIFDFDKLRNDINDGRGSIVLCGNFNKPQWAVCPNGRFGPNDIIAEEVEDFITSLLDEAIDADDSKTDGATAVQSFGNLLSGLQYDSAFEDCVNGKLNTIDDMDKDYDIQQRIANYTSIKDFRNEDIHYLKRKLRKIINMKTRDVNECMNLLNLGKSICSTGVADKTLMIGSLIFKVIGNDRIDIMRADNDERYKINKLIDELGPLIPKAVKNIIKISKEYETRVCNVPTNTTLLLERLYMDLYDKETKVTIDLTPNFDLNFNELANTTNFWFFIQKITVLIVMSLLLFMAANFVTIFLSRTQVITKVNEG
tara:strand:- start:45 stop:1604 length:1560 start_codon:yes stop_codon:yes gene_type:complete